jgi:hypothetical protein
VEVSNQRSSPLCPWGKTQVTSEQEAREREGGREREREGERERERETAGLDAVEKKSVVSVGN